MSARKYCKIPKCQRRPWLAGICKLHAREQSTGKPLTGVPEPRLSYLENAASALVLATVLNLPVDPRRADALEREWERRKVGKSRDRNSA